MENNNMEIWNAVCVTDPDVTKGVSIGNYNYTAVCAQSQIKKATELWGAIGNKWGVRNEEYNYATLVNINFCLYTAILYFPDGEMPIHADIEIIFSSGKRKGWYNEDFSKKVATDAMTKGLSKRGFNADIFEGKFDDNKYVAALKAQKLADKKGTDPPPPPTTEPKRFRQHIVADIVSVLTDKVFTGDERKGLGAEIKAIKTNAELEKLLTKKQAEQNRRIEDFEDDTPMSAEEEKAIDEATASLFPEEEQAAKDKADREALEPEIF